MKCYTQLTDGMYIGNQFLTSIITIYNSDLIKFSSFIFSFSDLFVNFSIIIFLF